MDCEYIYTVLIVSHYYSHKLFGSLIAKDDGCPEGPQRAPRRLESQPAGGFGL